MERFSLFGDPQIARAFAEMTSRPGAPHSVQTLSQKVGLSRSVFMARFSEVFGTLPDGSPTAIENEACCGTSEG